MSVGHSHFCARSAPCHRGSDWQQKGELCVQCSVFTCVGRMPLKEEIINPIDTSDNTPQIHTDITANNSQRQEQCCLDKWH